MTERNVLQKKWIKYIFQCLLVVLPATLILAHPTEQQQTLEKTIYLKVENKDLKTTMRIIEKAADVSVSYRHGLLNRPQKVNINVKNETLHNILEQVLSGTGIEYEAFGRQIVLTEKTSAPVVNGTILNRSEVTLAPSLTKELFNIQGTVTGTNGDPLTGASVVIKGTNLGTIVLNDGTYKLTISTEEKHKIIMVSYTGYKTVEEPIGGRHNINFVLEEGASLQEVTVIGYGSVNKSDLTGSVATIKPGQADATQFNTVDGLIRGRAAGIQVIQQAGDPGGAMSVKIRGVNSLRGDNEPLYVVDGVMINNVTADNTNPFAPQSGNTNQTRQSGLTGINPQDIASIEILKDASATAIYGSRGANGVVLITTKSGTGHPIVSFTTAIEMGQASKELKMLDAPTFAQYMNEVRANAKQIPAYNLDTIGEGVNWQRELQRKAISHNSRLTLSGASPDNKTKYYFAGGFVNNRGVVQGSFLKQGDIKINFSQELTRKLRIGLNLSGVASNNEMVLSTESTGSELNSFIMKMLIANPIRKAIPELDDPDDPFENPLSFLEDYDDIAHEKRIMSGLNLNYKINQSLSYRLVLAGDYRNKERQRWFGTKTSNGRNANGSLGLSQFERNFYQVENLLLFKKSYKNNSKLEGTVGVTYDNEHLKRSSVVNENFFTEALRTDGFGFGQLLYPYLRDRIGVEVFSGLARVNYNLREKYLLTLTSRTDGTSKFSKGNRFSYFPSAAFAWRLSEEAFLKQLPFIQSLKWRVGYGRSGNQAIGPYGTFARYGQINYSNGNTPQKGAVPLNIQNPDLKWETTSQFNTGLDFSLWNDRISGTLDAYHKTTKDLLQAFALPGSAAFTTVLRNIGTIQNKGIELSLEGNVYRSKRSSLNVSGNISFSRNKIVDLGLPVAQFGTYEWEAYIGTRVSNGIFFKDAANIFVTGKPIGLFYGYKTDGVFQTGEDLSRVRQFSAPVAPGDLKIVDVDGNGDINPEDKVLLGDPNPDFVYGFSTNFTYKKLSFDLFFNGVYGNDVINGNLARIGNPRGLFQNILASTYENAWRADAPTNNPRIGYNNQSFIDAYVEDGSFLRLATATLSYPFKFRRTNGIKDLTLSIIGKNLLTFTKYSGFDPEVNSFSLDAGRIGIDWNAYPNLRALSVSINAKF